MHLPKPDADGVRWYNKWGHQPGRREDPKKCVVEVSTSERWSSYHQCTRPRGHGPDGLYCKQHDPAAVKKRDDDARNAYLEKRHREGRPHRQRMAYQKALELIAEGHNDPRSLAIEALKTD